MADKEKRFLEIEKRLEAQAKLNPELVRLTKLTAEQGKKILKEYEAEFNKVLDGYKDKYSFLIRSRLKIDFCSK